MPIDAVLLQQITANDPILTSLDISNQNLIESDFTTLIEALKLNTFIETVDVSGNVLEDTILKTLACTECKFTILIASDCKLKNVSELLKIDRLKSLTLASNEIDAESIALLKENKVLTFLSLAGNNLNDQKVVTLAETTSITTLILSHNNITFVGATALAKNSCVVFLNLNENSLETQGAIELAKNTVIRELFVAGNRIATAGIEALAANRTFTTLDISFNKVGNSSAMRLFNHPTLINLNLSYNEISFEGIHPLPEGTPLQRLNISYNFLRDTGIIAISRHQSIQHLAAAGNKVGFEGTYALAMNRILQSLIYSSNSAGDAGTVILSQNTSLKELVLSYNSIKDSGAFALAANTTLKKLNLNYNMIGPKGQEALEKNNSLDVLTLSPEQPPEFTDENLNTIFLLSESFLCICDLKGTLQFFNPSFSRALGRPQDEILGYSFFKYLHPADRKSLEQQLTLDPNVIFYNQENRYQCKDGTYRIVSWTSNIIHSRMYAVGTDVTDKRRIEKDLMDVEQIALLHRVLAAENHSKKQREFISHLSHEIRNPLAGIMGLMESLQEKFNEIETVMLGLRKASTMIIQNRMTLSFASTTASMNEINICAEYIKAILDDNLDLVRITEEEFTLNNHPFELNKMLNEIISMFQEKAKKKKIKIILKVPSTNKAWISGDCLRFKKIIVNLVWNAVKFTHTGSITVSYILSNPTPDLVKVDVNVVDTGIGLNLKEQGELFQRYSQPGTGASYGGSGIGLFLSRQLAHKMGGDISVTSEKSLGSDFCVSMVFEAVHFIAKKEEKEIKTLTIQDEPEQSSLHILVVEDNITNQKMLCRILERANFTYAVAGNGLEAIDAFTSAQKNNKQFHVILMDIMMPLMGGLESTTKIRKIEVDNNLQKTPIIAITANSLQADREIGKAAGIDYYFTKPYVSEKIIKRIKILANAAKVVIKLTNQPLLGHQESAAPDFYLPSVKPSLSLSSRSNSTLSISLTDLEHTPSTSSTDPSISTPFEDSQRTLSLHSPSMFSSNLSTFDEISPQPSPTNSVRSSP